MLRKNKAIRPNMCFPGMPNTTENVKADYLINKYL